MVNERNHQTIAVTGGPKIAIRFGIAAAAVIAAVFVYVTYFGASNDPGILPLQVTAASIQEQVLATRGQWHVAPDGKPNGKGSIDSPWDLQTALAGGTQSRVNPGDVVWLRGGTYKGIFTSRLEGTPDAPIQVRSYKDEWAVIDKASASREKAALSVRAPHVWFRDFEVTNSFPNRNRLDAEGKMDPWRGSGINVWAANTKYINLVVHDNGHAFGLWDEDGGTEIYGCVMFNNGNNKKEHGVYGHNKTGTQVVRDNIIFNGAGYGLHIYANSSKASLSGFEIEGNAVFNNGVLMADDQVADQILVGGVKGVPASRILLRENYIYNRPDAPTSKNRGIRLGYEDPNNEDVRLLNNTIVSRVPLKILWWRSVEARGNTICSNGRMIEIETPQGRTLSDYVLEANAYSNGGSGNSGFLLNGEKIGAPELKKAGFDRVASVNDRPTRIFVRPNRYENGRANIVIYNWSLSPSVPVDLAAVLRSGDEYEVLDAENYLGDPVAAGKYDGRPVSFPMRLTKTTAPIGNVERVPGHTGIEFGVFVVRKRGS